jgi:hypothetical protein
VWIAALESLPDPIRDIRDCEQLIETRESHRKLEALALRVDCEREQREPAQHQEALPDCHVMEQSRRSIVELSRFERNRSEVNFCSFPHLFGSSGREHSNVKWISDDIPSSQYLSPQRIHLFI